LRARYRDALFEFVWAVLQPLLMTMILTLVFTLFIGTRVGQGGTEVPFAA
jgi:ABC-type polysaccharide/polyol phosphate export permease